MRYSDKFFEFSRFFTQFDTITFTLYHTKIYTFHLLPYFLPIYYDYMYLDKSKIFHVCFLSLYLFLLPSSGYLVCRACCRHPIASYTRSIWSFYVVVCAFMYVYLTSILKSLESANSQSFIKIFYVFQSIMYFHPVNLASIRSDTYFRILYTVYLVI